MILATIFLTRISIVETDTFYHSSKMCDDYLKSISVMTAGVAFHGNCLESSIDSLTENEPCITFDL